MAETDSHYSYEEVCEKLRGCNASTIHLSSEQNVNDWTELTTLLRDTDIVTSISVRDLPVTPSLVDAVATIPNLAVLLLDNVHLSAVGAKTVAESKSWRNLLDLNLQNNSKIGPRGIKSLAAKLGLATKLERLNLSNCRMEHFGAQALGTSCLPSSLVELDLSRNGIGNDGSWKLAPSMRALVNLKSLTLTKNQIGDDGASEFARQVPFLENLQVLDMSGNHVTNVGAIAAAVASSRLVKLDLSDNRIGDDGVFAMAGIIAQAESLEDLYLGGNQIAERGATALAEALAVSASDDNDATISSNLVTLSLRDNRIGDEGAGAFVEHLDANQTLVTLDLSGNKDISAARLSILNMLLKHRSPSTPSKPRLQAPDKAATATQAPESSPTESLEPDKETILAEARKLLQDASEHEPPEFSIAYLEICAENLDESVLSYGAFGDLFEATDSVLNETFAIRKIVVGQAGVMNDIREREFKEIVALRYSRHEHMEALRAYSLYADCYYLVYNVTHKTWLDECVAYGVSRAQMSWKVRLGIMHNVASALDFLHNARSCFHGDVKSANISVTVDYRSAQLVDGGVSRLLATDRARFQRGELVFGSRGYRCPRYERGSHKYGPESDIFSLGIVFAELCTGRRQNFMNAKTGQGQDFYYDYIVNETRDLSQDIDSSAGTLDKWALEMLCKIVLACINSEPKRRPGASTIVKLLGDLRNVQK